MQHASTWARQWSDTPPMAEQLRTQWPDHWVRFHFERAGRPDVEAATHLALAGDVLVTTYPLDGPEAPSIGELAASLRLIDFVVLHETRGAVVWRGMSVMTPRELLDRAMVDSQAGVPYRIALSSPDLSSLVFPYGLGVDVFADPDTISRLRSDLAPWRSDRPDGL